MAITYPLSLPASGIRSIRIIPRTAVAVSESPFTFQQQAQQHVGQGWAAEVTLPAMNRETAEEWVAFLLKLNGRQGTFLMGDPAGIVARGIATGTPLLNGAHNPRVNSLTTDGWTPSQTGILKAGDWIQIGSGASAKLHKNLNDVNSDGLGNATLDIWPALRTSYVDNTALIVSSTKGVFRLANNDMSYDINEAVHYGIGFSCVEAL